jgi:hypothetical protein
MPHDPEIIAAQKEGFSTAIILPALASTLRQAQREASPALHVLAAYARDLPAKHRFPLLSAEEDAAAARVAAVLTEQGISGPAFFLVVRLLVAAFGPAGGMLGQIAITANTMANPENHQSFNPGRSVVRRMGNWYFSLPQPTRRRFAAFIGRIARSCGYGYAHALPPGPGSAGILVSVAARPGTRKGWCAMIDREPTSPQSWDHAKGRR